MDKLLRVGRFAGALARHFAKGRPKCTQQQIDDRLEICKACPHLRVDHCSLCGCRCKGNQEFLNKLAWADQECPDGRWSAVDQEPEQ